MITFKEHTIPGYKARTVENAKANVTIAIASDFTTAGERCTRNAVKIAGKQYIPIEYHLIRNDTSRYRAATNLLHNTLNYSVETLNIAGNGIYSLFGEKQEAVDEYVFDLLNMFVGLRKQIIAPIPLLIKSGGQTGIDEAGLKAAVRLNIPALCLAPMDWLFRTVDGRDVRDEKLFKQRFL